MLVVFLALVIGVTVQEMPSSPAGKGIDYQSGYSMAPAIGSAIAVAAVLLLLGGVYHATARNEGVTFRESIFNWPLVIVAAIIALVFRL